MSGAADFLSKQAGPLPMGAWLLVGAGGLFIASRRNKDESQLVTDVREVPVPVGAIAVQDSAPVVITPIFRLPEIVNNINVPAGPAPVVNVGVITPAAPVAPAPPRPALAAPAPSSAPSPQRTHTVRGGDTLSALAARYYGSWTLWRRIYTANAAKIDGIARSRGKAPGGHWIFPGTVLVIP